MDYADSLDVSHETAEAETEKKKEKDRKKSRENSSNKKKNNNNNNQQNLKYSDETKDELLTRAERLLDSALDIHPYFDAALLNRGLLHLKKNEHLEASKYFARVLKVEPFNQKVLYNACLGGMRILRV
jgi:tetratricopeptide (TPR) repeat protein